MSKAMVNHPTQPPHGSYLSACSAQTGRLLVGTSGYSYAEWTLAGVYPPDIKPGQMLSYYAKAFPITELNHTWYQMPKAEAMERQRRQAPAGFLFCAKLARTLTHEVDPENWRADAARYRDGIVPLVQARQLVAVLVQFGSGFDRSLKHRHYLASLLDELCGLPVAVEFQHDSWANDRVFAELERRKVALVSVDEPRLPGFFPSLNVVTNPDLFYVRFHGRNALGWRSGRMSLQFDYDYSDDELQGWIEQKIIRMVEQAKCGVLFFNNHVQGQAPKNARRLVELLNKAGILEERHG